MTRGIEAIGKEQGGIDMPVGDRSRRPRYFLRFVVLMVVVVVSGWLYYRYGPDGLEFEWLLEPQFNCATPFGHGVAWVQEKEGGPYKLIDKKGRAVVRDFSAKYVSPADVLSYFEGPGNLEGYVDLTGKVVVPPRYQSVSGIKDGFGVVKSGDLYGIIDEKGQTVLPIMYERFIYIFGANLFGVKSGDKWGYVNGRNEAITDFVFDEPSMWDDCPRGTCVAVLNGKSGLLDEKGRWVLPASYDQIYSVVRGEAEENPKIGVCCDGKVGFVDLQGNTVIDFQFWGPWGDCYQFSEGLASVALSDPESTKDAFGVIDETGKVLFRFSEEPLGVFREGYMVVQSERGTHETRMVMGDEEANYSLIDRTGKLYPLPTWLEPIGVKEVVNGTLLVRVRQKVPWYEERKFGYLSIP